MGFWMFPLKANQTSDGIEGRKRGKKVGRNEGQAKKEEVRHKEKLQPIRREMDNI